MHLLREKAGWEPILLTFRNDQFTRSATYLMPTESNPNQSNLRKYNYSPSTDELQLVSITVQYLITNTAWITLQKYLQCINPLCNF